MSRIARVVVPGCWHHVTQRGNRRQMVFLQDADRTLYLQLLRDYCRRWSVSLLGYCLMGNHVHLVASPASDDGLARALGRVHNDYARWFNVRRSEVGHLWQNRFYSAVLDDAHRWDALRYIELNPVRAGLAERPIDWRWSSARAHLFGDDHAGVLDLTEWRTHWSPESWEHALDQGVADAFLAERIREATRTGRPLGSAEFVAELEGRLGRPLRPRRRGPKRKSLDATAAQMELGIA